MRMPSRRRASLTIVALLASCLPFAAGSAAAAPAGDGVSATSAVTAAVSGDVTFSGHGWGHGRGMGQYGALGYAVDHGWSYGQILAHYYSNTTSGSIGNPEISVNLASQESDAGQFVIRATTLTVAGTPIGEAWCPAAGSPRVGCTNRPRR